VWKASSQAIIIGREIAISALREWMAQIGRSRNVAVSFLGKIKTVSQMTGNHSAVVSRQNFLAEQPRDRQFSDLCRRDSHVVVDGLLSENGPSGVEKGRVGKGSLP
jgi:hypothetical protein